MKTIAAKVSDELYDQLRQVADEHGITVSKMIVQALETGEIRDTRPQIELLRQINRIGNNLNQIARRCNSQKFVDREVLESLFRIEEEVKRLIP